MPTCASCQGPHACNHKACPMIGLNAEWNNMNLKAAARGVHIQELENNVILPTEKEFRLMVMHAEQLDGYFVDIVANDDWIGKNPVVKKASISPKKVVATKSGSSGTVFTGIDKGDVALLNAKIDILTSMVTSLKLQIAEKKEAEDKDGDAVFEDA